MKILLSVVLLLQVNVVSAQMKGVPAKSPPEKSAKAPEEKQKSWAEIQKELSQIIAKYQDKKLSLSKKQDLVLPANELIAQTLSLKFLPDQKADQIAMMVELMRVSQGIDDTNTHADSLSPDFKLYKKAYLSAIEKIKSPEDRKHVLEDFQDWETYEKNADSEAESEIGAEE